ncbi:hypothetical protein CMI37_18185 [Candidatus Pacearchaeota archaeon]|jgi:hypothetical protein|nr:hypothetical protein [Candidatus Pacearchaeota archaeon]|tara:strand:- start:1818 stop:2012 length:195 start_codon:yes stop_codon:yes gene_type:complete
MCYPHKPHSYLLKTLMKDMTWMDNYEFMQILKHLVSENKDLQKRLDIMEEILHSYLPVVGEEDE